MIRNGYYLYFVLISFLAFCLAHYFPVSIGIYVVIGYFVCGFAFLLFRYLSLLINLSEILKKDFPEYYRQNKGVSRLGDTYMITPTIVFKSVFTLELNNEQNKVAESLKSVLILLPTSFIGGIGLIVYLALRGIS